jgi:hypothetical protein
MKWRFRLELTGPDGTVSVHEVGGCVAVAEYAWRMIKLTLAEGNRVLAAPQVNFVQAQAEYHCCRQRRCQHCGTQGTVKDQFSVRSVLLFGTMKVGAPRFNPFRWLVTCGLTFSPFAEIRPDRCTPDYELAIAQMGTLVPYRRVPTLLSEFLPFGKPQSVGRIRNRTFRVNARLRQDTIVGTRSKSTVVAKSTALTIYGGYVRTARRYGGHSPCSGRSPPLPLALIC